MTERVDLHLHTTASDGSLSPSELVEAALAAGMTSIAITDHDSVAGILPAQAAARGSRLRVLAGVELNADHEGHSLHLLGYGFDSRAPTLLQGLQKLALCREARAKAIVERLAAGGTPVAWTRVLAHSRGTVGRPHIGAALVEAGHAADLADAFRRLIGESTPAYLPSGTLGVPEVVELVRKAGGQVALAHSLRAGRALPVEALIEGLHEAGVSGVEVYHTEHDAEATARLKHLAARLSLWWSGGSDFHRPHTPRTIGGVSMPPAVLTQGPFGAALEHG